MAEEDEFEGTVNEDGTFNDAPGGAPSWRRYLWASIILVIVLGGAGGTWYWWESTQSAAPVTPRALATPLYLSIDPPLVTNFEVRGQLRFLQTQMEIMARDQMVIDAVVYHMPVIRNQLLLLMNDQSYERLSSREGREAIRVEALEEIRRVLREVGAPANVEAVYFTGFVMQ